jgi:outer membrane protein
MIKKLLTIFVLLNGSVFAQQKNSFSLNEAVEFATKNSPSYGNAELDMQSAINRKNETMGAGLPQVSASIDFKDYLKIPTSLIPAKAFNPAAPSDLYAPVKFGVQYQATAGFSASQLIFSADYFLGIKMSKEFLNLSRINVQRSKTELVAQVSKAYYGVLVGKERLKLLDINMAKLDKSLSDLKAYYQQGLIEQIDVERLEVASNNLKNEKEKTLELIKTGENLLKFQMGYKIYDEITLTDSLNLTEDLKQALSTTATDISKRPDYQLMVTQQRFSEADLKRLQFGYLPNLVAYGSYQFNTQRTNANIFETDKNVATKQWYPIALIGVTMNLNIFDGLQRHYKIQQAKITISKNANNIKNLEFASQMESSMAAISFNNALKSLENNKRNLELAKHVYDVSQKKYDQGVGNNLEIVNAQSSLREAEVNYYNSVYDALVSKIDYLKATGILVK